MRFRSTELVVDDAERRRRDREELLKRQRLQLAESSRWPRLDLEALRFERYEVVHMPTSERYRIVRGEILDAQFTPVTAWAITPDGPLFLEPA